MEGWQDENLYTEEDSLTGKKEAAGWNNGKIPYPSRSYQFPFWVRVFILA